jgi:hypothetical protein
MKKKSCFRSCLCWANFNFVFVFLCSIWARHCFVQSARPRIFFFVAGGLLSRFWASLDLSCFSLAGAARLGLTLFGPWFAHTSRSPFSRSGAALVSIFRSLLWFRLDLTARPCRQVSVCEPGLRGRGWPLGLRFGEMKYV